MSGSVVCAGHWFIVDGILYVHMYDKPPLPCLGNWLGKELSSCVQVNALLFNHFFVWYEPYLAAV
jgi:hypothetical protein